MPIYRLTPRNLDHHHWSASTNKSACLVHAENEKRARQYATREFAIAVQRGPGVMIPINPWSQEDLVVCNEAEHPEIEYSEGTVEYPARPSHYKIPVGMATEVDSAGAETASTHPTFETVLNERVDYLTTENGEFLETEDGQRLVVEDGTRGEPKNDTSRRIRRLDLVATEPIVILSDPSGVSSESIRFPLQESQAQLKRLAETLDGFVGEDAPQSDGANKIEIPMVEEDLDLLRHFVAAAIILGDAPRITQDSMNLMAGVLNLLRQAGNILNAANDGARIYQPLITSIGTLAALVAAVAAINN